MRQRSSSQAKKAKPSWRSLPARVSRIQQGRFYNLFSLSLAPFFWLSCMKYTLVPFGLGGALFWCTPAAATNPARIITEPVVPLCSREPLLQSQIHPFTAENYLHCTEPATVVAGEPDISPLSGHQNCNHGVAYLYGRPPVYTTVMSLLNK